MSFIHRAFATACLISLGLFQPGSAYAALPFDQQYLRVTDYGRTVRDALVTADFNGDGIDEVFAVGNNFHALLSAYTQEPDGLRLAQYFKLPIPTGGRTELHAWAGSGGPQLALVTSYGFQPTVSQVRIYRGWPLREQATYSIPMEHSTSAVGDVDGDGLPELIVSTSSDTRALRLATGQTLWVLPTTYRSDIALANLDADPALEMVVAGFPAVVYDGATRATEWSWQDGFGSFVAAGNIGTGGIPGFVGARDWDLFTVFRSAPWSPEWDYLRSDIDGVAVANLDGVGADEIIQSDGQWGAVNIFDTQTRSLRRAIPNPGNGVAAVAAIQTTHTPGKDLVFAPAGYTGPEGMVLRVVRSADGATLHDLNAEPGGFPTTTIGDLDADGRVELAMASFRDTSRIRIIDRDTGVEEWISPAIASGANAAFGMVIRVLLQAQLDADPALELVAAGRNVHDGQFIVIDSLTKEIQLQVGRPSALDARTVAGGTLLDYDGDGFQDLALITHPSHSGESGVRVHVFSLRTGLALWESVRIGQSNTIPRGIHVQPGDEQALLVAGLSEGLRAFGVQSQLIEWTYTASSPTLRVVYAPAAPGGAEIIIEDEDGTVTHLDASTRTERRSYQLTAASKGIFPLPGAPFLLTAEAQGLALRSMTGALLGLAPEAVASEGYSPVAVAARGTQFDVLTGLVFGYVLHTLNPDGIYADGFEAD